MGISPLIGLGGLCYVFYFVFTWESKGFSGFFDVPSLVLIGAGPPCVMMLSHSFQDLFNGVLILFRSAFNRLKQNQREVIDTLTACSQMVRSDGIGSLMQARQKIRYDLLRDGVSLIVNDFTVDEIKHNLAARINAKQGEMLLAANLFENMSKVGPALGLMGTLIGLVQMLANMSDPSKIGPGMALAMISTLYGIIFGTIMCAPASEKIQLEAERSLEIDKMVLDGVLSLKGKKSSVHLRDIVRTYAKGRGEGGEANAAKR